jgi:hypothetical protein
MAVREQDVQIPAVAIKARTQRGWLQAARDRRNNELRRASAESQRKRRAQRVLRARGKELFTMGVGNYTEQDVREDSAHFAAATTSELFGDRVHHRVWRGPAP